MVWGKLVEYLSNRDLILSELEKQRQDAGQTGVYEAELERIQRHLKAADREQRQAFAVGLEGLPC